MSWILTVDIPKIVWAFLGFVAIVMIAVRVYMYFDVTKQRTTRDMKSARVYSNVARMGLEAYAATDKKLTKNVTFLLSYTTLGERPYITVFEKARLISLYKVYRDGFTSYQKEKPTNEELIAFLQKFLKGV